MTVSKEFAELMAIREFIRLYIERNGRDVSIPEHLTKSLKQALDNYEQAQAAKQQQSRD